MIVTKIQLTGELKGYLDIEDSKAVPVIFSSSDIRDISTKKGNTSRNITLSNTKNNHDLLGYYFNVNVKAGTFNVNKLTTCVLLQNGVPILDNAVLQLLSVKKTGLNNNYTDEVIYEVVIKDSTADFFTKLGGKELTELDFSELDHVYNLTNVVNSFSHTVDNGYKYLLPYNTGNNYNLEEFKPAIYAKKYFDRIFQTNGFTYEWGNLTDDKTRFDKLIVPFNGDEKKITENILEDLEVIAEKTIVQNFSNTETAGFNTPITVKKISITTELKDLKGYYDNVNSIYANEFLLNGVNSLDYEIDIDWELDLYNSDLTSSDIGNGIFTYYPKISITNNTGQVKASYLDLFTENTGLKTVYQYSSRKIAFIYSTPNIFTSGSNVVAKGVKSFVLNAKNINISEDLKLNFSLDVVAANAAFWYKHGTFDASNTKPIIRINSIKIRIVPNVESIGYSFPIFINKYIPLKIKQSDFIKSIFTLYNLYTEVDSFNPKKLILKKRDEYYDEGKSKDWTNKRDKNKDSILTFLPSLQNKRTILSYKQDEDAPNKGYFENTGEVYGQVEYIYDNEFVKDIDRKELIFSPTPITETTFGAIVPILNGRTPKTNIRLLHDGGELGCGNYTILEYTGATPATINFYPLLSHFDREYNPTFDVNFAVCDYYFYSTLGTNTNNNMYNLNWRRTFSQINNGKMLTAYFYLDEGDINSLKLSDKIFVLDCWYNINKVEYNANSKESTRVELVTVDTEQFLGSFKTKKKGTTKKGGNIFGRVKEIAKDVFRVNNINESLVPTEIIGKNNIVSEGFKGGAIYGNSNIINSEKALVIGDNFTVDASGIYAERFVLPNGEMLDESTVGNIATKDLILTAYRNVDLSEYGINFHNGNVLFDSLGLNIYTVKIKSEALGTDKASLILENINEAGQTLLINGGVMRFNFIPQYDNEAAASSLETGTVYKTSTGEIRIKLEPTI